jgi:5-methyltetrahydropteroyltriglutamate--homocysteine methyltransferase
MERIRTTTLGIPRIGARRELKTALEAHWKGGGVEALRETARNLRRSRWLEQRQAGIELVPSNDFSLYDHVLDMSCLLGNIPERFGGPARIVDEALRFEMARGSRNAHACAMSKWFDTNYHFIVPEFAPDTRFSLSDTKPFDEFEEALGMGVRTRPVLVGPVTYLLSGTASEPGFDPLELLPRLVATYAAILRRLAALGADWVQLDEPFLACDLSEKAVSAFRLAYATLASAQTPALLVANYFGGFGDNLDLAASLPVAGLHADLVRGRDELPALLARLDPETILSLGIVDGRNVWKTDSGKARSTIEAALERRPAAKLLLAPSCSLLHVPCGLEHEPDLPAELRANLAFASEKLVELVAFGSGADLGRIPSSRSVPGSSDPAVREKACALGASDFRRAAPFSKRKALQERRLRLPPFPTTTIGSFPQTAEIRSARAGWKAGRITDATYSAFLEAEMRHVLALQEEIGLDLLVHGEYERNDMVEHFAELLEGFAATANGWVQSYGSRCVKPPLLFGDVSRRAPLTLEWARKAKEATTRPVKGMLTGPVTMVQWSFVREDLPRADVAFQVALALRGEIDDLQNAGVPAIQVDEPALREGLPLRRAARAHYLDWAVDAFRLATAVARPDVQIHTHMCYSRFSDILASLAKLDADVLTIETARSRMALLDEFDARPYPADIGPGVWDIHSPRVPSVDEMVELLETARRRVGDAHLWVNPDCGLKTRGWRETIASLRNMVAAAGILRQNLAMRRLAITWQPQFEGELAAAMLES